MCNGQHSCQVKNTVRHLWLFGMNNITRAIVCIDSVVLKELSLTYSEIECGAWL